MKARVNGGERYKRAVTLAPISDAFRVWSVHPPAKTCLQRESSPNLLIAIPPELPSSLIRTMRSVLLIREQFKPNSIMI